MRIIQILKTPVILSAAGSAQSALPAKSKDPFPVSSLRRLRREFSHRCFVVKDVPLVISLALLTTLPTAKPQPAPEKIPPPTNPPPANKESCPNQARAWKKPAAPKPTPKA